MQTDGHSATQNPLKYVTYIIAEPKYKYGQQEQVTARNHNRSTALERLVLPEDQWSCIAHLSAENMLKSAVIEEKKFKHSPRVEADNH